MRRVRAKFVPYLLNDFQKENWFEVCEELFGNANGNENS